MIARKTLLVLCLIPVLICSAVCIWYLIHKPTLADPSLPFHVQTGDLIFTVGHSLKSDVVRTLEWERISKTKYSHVGIISLEEDSVFVVHMSVDDGFIRHESLNTFIQRNKVVCYSIFRLRQELGTLNDDRLNHLLKGYLHEQKKFDYLFDMKDESLFYCTELIMHILNYIKIDHLEDIRFEKYLYPNDIINSKLFIQL